jgi:hypothetical protein
VKLELPPSYVVYLFGHMFAKTRLIGHKHIISKKRLDPVQLRKAIKLACIVHMYNLGYINFEIATKKSSKKEKELFIILVKDIEPCGFLIEDQLISLLKNGKKLKLTKFQMRNLIGLGFEEKIYMDRLANQLNNELVNKGFLKLCGSNYVINQEIRKLLEEYAFEVKRNILKFREERKEVFELLMELL